MAVMETPTSTEEDVMGRRKMQCGGGGCHGKEDVMGRRMSWGGGCHGEEDVMGRRMTWGGG